MGNVCETLLKNATANMVMLSGGAQQAEGSFPIGAALLIMAIVAVVCIGDMVVIYRQKNKKSANQDNDEK